MCSSGKINPVFSAMGIHRSGVTPPSSGECPPTITLIPARLPVYNPHSADVGGIFLSVVKSGNPKVFPL
ncbi:hypothetical protein QUA04_11995, partial [Microcoleus sp. S13_C5]